MAIALFSTTLRSMATDPTDTLKDAAESAQPDSSGNAVSIDLQFADDGKLNNVSVDGTMVTQVEPPASPEPYSNLTGNEPLDLLINTLLDFANQFIQHLPVIGVAVLAFVLAMSTAGLSRRLARRGFNRVGLKGSQSELIANFIFVLLFCVACLLSLAIIFPDLSLGKLFTYLGIASLVLGFAFRDILENYFAGMLLLWQFPFEIGDYVEIETDTGPVRGEVKAIHIRMTVIRKISNDLVVVPNATMYKYPLSIETWAEAKRQSLQVQVAYDSDLARTQTLIQTAVQDCKSVDQRHDVHVVPIEFADSGMLFEVAWWANARPLDMWLSRGEISQSVHHVLAENDIEIPYPHRKLIGWPDSLPELADIEREHNATQHAKT